MRVRLARLSGLLFGFLLCACSADTSGMSSLRAVDTQPQASKDSALWILDDCGETVGCVKMVLSRVMEEGQWTMESLVPLGHAAQVVEPDPGGSYGVFRHDDFRDVQLNITGRLAGGPMRRHLVWVRVYVSGLDCSGFGNRTVPVVGHSSVGNPLLLTTGGELEVVEEWFDVGCKDCIELIDRDSLEIVARRRSPAWDLSFTAPGVGVDALSYDEAGVVYLQRGDTCLQLHENRRFEPVSAARCTTTSVVGSYDEADAWGVSLTPAEWLLDNPSSRNLARLQAGACT